MRKCYRLGYKNVTRPDVNINYSKPYLVNFSIPHSPFLILHSSFSNPSSSLPVLHSPFFFPRSSFPVLHSQFFIFRSAGKFLIFSFARVYYIISLFSFVFSFPFPFCLFSVLHSFSPFCSFSSQRGN